MSPHGLAVSVDTAFGLAFDVEETDERTSGFKPAHRDLGANRELFGELRLLGFAALLQVGFAERLVLVGGNEGRYKDRHPPINRAWAIRKMLIDDYEIDPNRVDYVPSHSNTGGNITAIQSKIDQYGIVHRFALVSNHYHLPRAQLDLVAAKLPLPLYAAEAFWLLENDTPGRKAELVEHFGGGPLAERVAEEIQGITHKVRGTYTPRTNTGA